MKSKKLYEERYSGQQAPERSATTEASLDIVNLSGYRFVSLDNLEDLRIGLLERLEPTGIQGTIMLAHEGINVALAGTDDQAAAARSCLNEDPRLANIWLKESRSATVPFPRLKVRIRFEIIAFDGQAAPDARANRPLAPAIAPQTLCDWLNEERDITLLDARNNYEIVSGTFASSEHVNIKHFRHFKSAVEQALEDGTLDMAKPLVTYCTGGIRCEKAAPWLLERGFSEVYQVEGGLLNYFATCGNEHWEGDCFVFDERVEVDTQLLPTGAGLCDHCKLAVPAGTQCRCQLS